MLRSLFTSKATLKRKPIVLKKSSLEAVAPQIRLGVLKEIDTNCQKVLCDENDRISKNASIPKDMIPDEPPITLMDSTMQEQSRVLQEVGVTNPSNDHSISYTAELEPILEEASTLKVTNEAPLVLTNVVPTEPTAPSKLDATALKSLLLLHQLMPKKRWQSLRTK